MSENEMKVGLEEFKCDSIKSLISLCITSAQYLFFLLQFFLCSFCLLFGDRISGYKKRLVEGDWDKNWLIWCLKMSHESWLVLFLLITHSMGGKTHENWNEIFLQSVLSLFQGNLDAALCMILIFKKSSET